MSTALRRRTQVTQPELIVNRFGSRKWYNWLRLLRKLPPINYKVTESAAGVSAKCAVQVRLDVDRAFSFDSGFPSRIEDKRERLYRVIIKVLSRNSAFKYYQGFHEICSLFVIVFEDEEECIEAIERFSNNFLSAFLQNDNDSFDKILQKCTREALKISSLYALELGKLRLANVSEKKQFSLLIEQISKLVEPHGLIASWFLTWFVHEFPNFGDSLKVFDFQLTELCTPTSSIYLASSLIVLHRERLCEWREDPFELIMFFRNLPKIASSQEAIECARLLCKAHPPQKQFGTTRRRRFISLYTGTRFWTILLTLHFVYYILSITLLPALKHF